MNVTLSKRERATVCRRMEAVAWNLRELAVTAAFEFHCLSDDPKFWEWDFTYEEVEDRLRTIGELERDIDVLTAEEWLEEGPDSLAAELIAREHERLPGVRHRPLPPLPPRVARQVATA